MINTSHNSENKLETLQIDSSQPTDYTITLNDSSLGYNYHWDNSGSITISVSPSIDTIDISNITGVWEPPKPFVDSFPEWNDFQKMSKEYPALEKAYEHLKSYYNMCKDDWEVKKQEDAG